MKHSERDRLIVALRRDLPLLVLAGLGLWGYLDLRGRIDRTAERPVTVANVEPPAGKTEGVAEQDQPPVQPQEPPQAVPAPDSSWGCAGEVTTEELAVTLKQHGGSVVECYRGLLSVLPGAEGTYLITMQVGSDGSVVDARFGGTLEDEQLDECVVRALGTWRFPPRQGGGCVIAFVPYVLNPENAFD